jgi:twitching motility protein PilT
VDLNEILREGVNRGASDIHLKVGSAPIFRVSGTLMTWEEAGRLDRDAMGALSDALLKKAQADRLRDTLQVDVGYGHPDLGRFRVNVFYQRGDLQAGPASHPAARAAHPRAQPAARGRARLERAARSGASHRHHR